MTPPIPVVRKVSPREPRSEAIRIYSEAEEQHRAYAEAFRLDRMHKKADKEAWRGYLAHRALVAESNDPDPRPMSPFRFCCVFCGLYALKPSSEKQVPLMEVDPDA